MTKTIIYTRVSRGEEGEETSTKIQEKDCREYAKRKELGRVSVLSDVGISGFSRKVERPDWDKLLSLIRDGKVDNVVVYKLDRLTRQMRQLVEFIDLIDEHRVAFHSVNDSIDTSTPTGKAMLQIMGAMAELESETIKLRVKRGMKAVAESGKPHMGGRQPYGWKPDRVTLEPSEAAHINEVVDRFIRGESMYSILKDTTGTSRSVAAWMGRLRNPRLIGYRNHNGELHESDIEPIIEDLETWNRLQKRLGDNTRIVTTSDGRQLVINEPPKERKWRTREADPFQPLLRCGKCDATMRKSGVRYMCSESGCASIHVEPLRELLSREAISIATGMRAGRITPEVDHKALTAERVAVAGRLEDLARDYYVDQAITEPEFRVAREALVTKLGELDDQLAAATNEDLTWTLHGRNTVSLELWWNEALPPARAALLRDLFESVTIRPYREVVHELRDESKAARIPWPGRPGKAEMVLQRQVRIEGTSMRPASRSDPIPRSTSRRWRESARRTGRTRPPPRKKTKAAPKTTS